MFYMNVKEQIQQYLDSQSETKRKDMEALHKLMLKVLPKGKLWFFDGMDDKGKKVTNPNVGHGAYIIKYADGKTREFYQVGFSGNSTGISVFIMGIDDKKYLPSTFAKTIGKATVTGYCIKFKTLLYTNISQLEEAIRFGVKATT